MIARPALLLLVSLAGTGCAGTPGWADGVPGADGTGAAGGVGAPPAWVARPAIARTDATPLLCCASGQAPIEPDAGGDARAYARAAEAAQRDAAARLARRSEAVLARAGLADARAAVVQALRDGARVRGRYVDGTRYHVWLASDLEPALAAAGIHVDDALRASLARALDKAPDEAPGRLDSRSP
jgi:hypothetical protein